MYPIYYPCYGIPCCPIMQHPLPVYSRNEDYMDVKDYRNSKENEPEAKKMEETDEVYKDDFVQGFVPNHNHGSVDYTSINDGHVHQCLDVSFPPTPSEDGTHVHYTEGYVLFEDGHNHYYKACSGPAIPVGRGMHVHYYDFYTTENDGHRHRITGVDMPAPGTL